MKSIKMKWTKDIPTETGWYWFVEEGFEDYFTCLQIIEVFKVGKNFSCTLDSWYDNYNNFLWAGPILIPEEP